ncbi:MAG: hypothetical protein QG668_611 [Patescibacteria group bacterium]|nr:hypothetical protein [Patescibacteria group bacterium]
MHNAPSFENPWKRPPPASAKFLQERKTLERVSRDHKPTPSPIQPMPDFSVYKPDPSDPVLSWEEEVTIPPVSEYTYVPEAHRPAAKGLRPSSINTGKALRFALGLHGLGIGSPIVKDAITQQVERSYQRRVVEGEQRREHQNRENTRRARNILHQQWTESFTHPTSELPSGFYGRNVLERNRIDFDEVHEEVIARRISEEAFPRYQEALQRFRSALRQEMRSVEGGRRLSIQQISRALRVATDGYTYLGGGSDQVGLLLLDKLGSCAQISIFATLLLADAGFPREKIFLRFYNGDQQLAPHVAPILVWEGQEQDLSAGARAFPFGARVPFEVLSELYQRKHGLGAEGRSIARVGMAVSGEDSVYQGEGDREGLPAAPSGDEEADGGHTSGGASCPGMGMPAFASGVTIQPGLDRPFPGSTPFQGGAIFGGYDAEKDLVVLADRMRVERSREREIASSESVWSYLLTNRVGVAHDPLFSRGLLGGELPVGSGVVHTAARNLPVEVFSGSLGRGYEGSIVSGTIEILNDQQHYAHLTTEQHIHTEAALLYAYEWAMTQLEQRGSIQGPVLARRHVDRLRESLRRRLDALSIDEQIDVCASLRGYASLVLPIFWAQFPERVNALAVRALERIDLLPADTTSVEDIRSIDQVSLVLTSLALYHPGLSGQLREGILGRLVSSDSRYQSLRIAYAQSMLYDYHHAPSSFTDGIYSRMHGSAQALFSSEESSLIGVYKGYRLHAGERPEDRRYDRSVQRLARNIPTPVLRAFVTRIRHQSLSNSNNTNEVNVERFIGLLNGVISERETLDAPPTPGSAGTR